MAKKRKDCRWCANIGKSKRVRAFAKKNGIPMTETKMNSTPLDFRGVPVIRVGWGN